LDRSAGVIWVCELARYRLEERTAPPEVRARSRVHLRVHRAESGLSFESATSRSVFQQEPYPDFRPFLPNRSKVGIGAEQGKTTINKRSNDLSGRDCDEHRPFYAVIFFYFFPAVRTAGKKRPIFVLNLLSVPGTYSLNPK